MNYAYIRVSTTNQDERRQEISLENFKIDKVYCDKLSGKNSDRVKLNKLRLVVKNGDMIYCESISRLGRNVDDLRKLVEEFVIKGVTVHFIKEGVTTVGTGYKFLITILGAVAEMERELIVERVNEGIRKAKKYGTKNGVPFGRPKRTIPDNFIKYYKKWIAKDITAVEFARLMKLGRTTLYRYIDQYKKDLNN